MKIFMTIMVMTIMMMTILMMTEMMLMYWQDQESANDVQPTEDHAHLNVQVIFSSSS